MERLLRSLGYKVHAFSSASEFISSPHLGETACLIADVNMPVMTGLALYKQLVDTGHRIPTILVTAFPEQAEIWENASGLLAGLKMMLGSDPKQDYRDKVARVDLRH